jgi:hypothetical protein
VPAGTPSAPRDRRRVDRLRHRRRVDDQGVADQRLEGNLVDAGVALEEVVGRVDVGAGVRAEVDGRDVGDGAIGDRLHPPQRHARVAGIDRHAGPNRDADVEDLHQGGERGAPGYAAVSGGAAAK